MWGELWAFSCDEGNVHAKIWIIWKSGKLDFAIMLEKLRILPTNCYWNEINGLFAVNL